MNDGVHLNRLPAALYVVATPIGNLGDLTLRALEVLKRVERIAAEDTRVTGVLLQQHGLRKPMISIREHNEEAASGQVIDWIGAGEAIAYVSDAGTPAISDPGARLVAAVRAAGLKVVPIPGASAVTCALSAAGIPDAGWFFQGFLPAKPGARDAQIKTLAALPCALVIYEAPHRILETVAALTAHLGARPLTIARELTKQFEEIHTLPLPEASNWLTADPHRTRGEFVLIVHPPGHTASADDAEALRVLEILVNELPPPLAAKLAARITGRSKAELYQMTLKTR